MCAQASECPTVLATQALRHRASERELATCLRCGCSCCCGAAAAAPAAAAAAEASEWVRECATESSATEQAREGEWQGAPMSVGSLNASPSVAQAIARKRQRLKTTKISVFGSSPFN